VPLAMKQAKDRAIDKEQYFTCENVVKIMLQTFSEREPERWRNIEHVIEPSAGGGAFLKQMQQVFKSITAYDIVPCSKNVLQQDFLALEPTQEQQEQRTHTACIGNPPFGIRGAMARRFLNQCAKFADTIYMILPISFKTPQMMSSVNKHYHIEWTVDLPVNIWEDVTGKLMSRKIKTAAFFMVRKDFARPSVVRHTMNSINEQAQGWCVVSTKTSNKKHDKRKQDLIRKSDVAFFLWNVQVEKVKDIKDFNTGRYHVVRLSCTHPTKHVLQVLREEYAKVRKQKAQVSTLGAMVALALPDLLQIMTNAIKALKL